VIAWLATINSAGAWPLRQQVCVQADHPEVHVGDVVNAVCGAAPEPGLGGVLALM
jgi:hypothetical protein